VGTTEAIYYRPAAVGAGWQRIGWADVARAGRPRDANVLILRLWSEAEARAMPLRPRSRLADFATERVAACRLFHTRVDVGDGCSVTVAAHRASPTAAVTWTVRPNGGRDCAGDATDVLREIRRQVGC
jgi:hypothetical protein